MAMTINKGKNHRVSYAFFYYILSAKATKAASTVGGLQLTVVASDGVRLRWWLATVTCNLHGIDLKFAGMDEDKGPQSRKLYVEFAELWPAGYMDNLGIKDAIYRAKKRRQHKLQVGNKERIERKKLAAKVKLQEPTLIAQPQAGQERHMVPTFRVPRPQDKPISSLSPSIQNKLNDPTPFRSDTYGSKHHEKARRISADIISDVGSKIISTDMRKKMKMQAPPEMVKHYLYRPNNGTSLSLQQSKPSTQMPASATSVQPS